MMPKAGSVEAEHVCRNQQQDEEEEEQQQRLASNRDMQPIGKVNPFVVRWDRSQRIDPSPTVGVSDTLHSLTFES